MRAFISSLFCLVCLYSCGNVGPQEQKSNAAPVAEHQEQWSVFLRQSGQKPAVITVDQGWEPLAPLASHPRLLQVSVLAEGRLSTGFPTDAEIQAANTLQSQLLQKLERGNYGVFVGSRVTVGQKDFYFYLRAEPDADQLAQSVVESYTKRKTEASIQPDSAWTVYGQKLYPNAREQAEISNDGVLIRLQEAGDPLNIPRPIEHWAYFKTTKARSVFEDSIEQYAFRPLNYDTLAGAPEPYGIHFVRNDSIHTPYIHNLTWGLTELAASLGGSYDGWETIVVKPQ